jgi:hypothetical protein
VYDCGIAPEYFLDEMSSDEVGYLSKAYYKAYKERWEMLRFSNHAILSSQSTKKLDVTDVMKFDWDDEALKSKLMTEEEITEARERIKKKFNL